MDETQVLALINTALGSSLKSAFAEFRSYTNEQLKPISEKLASFEVAPLEPEVLSDPGSASPEMAALTARLAAMEKQESDRQAEVKAYKFSNDLGASISKVNPLHSELVKELLSSRYSSKAVEKDGEWYLPSGAKVSEEVEGFFKSDIGQHFIANPAVGGGTVPSVKTGDVPKAPATADDMLADMII